MKKKGFTLIELLAVIIILGVIALIATPIIINVLEESKEKSRMQSVVGYADAVRLSYVEEQLNNTGKPLGELASEKMQGEEVSCNISKYDEKYGTVLYGCNVEGKGNYCYMSGQTYDSDTKECENILSIATNGKAEYKTPSITVVSQTPENTLYATSKEIKISYPSLMVVEEQYFVKANESIEINNVVSKCGNEVLPNNCEATTNTTLEKDTWYQLSGEVNFSIDKNIKIEAVTGNNNEYGSVSTYIEDKIDTTKPVITESTITTTSNKAVVKANCSDSESGISKYYFSIDNKDYIDNGNNDTHAFTKLTQNVEYSIKVKCVNGSDISDEITNTSKMSEMQNPTITQASQTPADSEYAQERVIRITYYDTNIETPSYYYSLDGSEWIEVTTTTKDITFTSNGYLYAKTMDDSGNIVNATVYTVTNIDVTAPTIPTSGAIGSVSGSNVTGSVQTEASGSTDTGVGGITYKYLIKNDSETPLNTDTGFTTTKTFTRSCGTSYYAWAIAEDALGNRSAVKYLGTTSDGANSYSGWGTCSKTCGTGSQTRTNTCALVTTGLSQNCNIQACCAYSAGQVWNYAYTGRVQSFTVPCAGTYKLEVWGAQGGTHQAGCNEGSPAGAYGGYAYGNITLSANTTLYITVGGQGSSGASGSSGGYNGGGAGLRGLGVWNANAGGGGGATHIAKTNRGILSNYSSYKSEVLIVAGGGGGGKGWNESDRYYRITPGTGGGTSGGSSSSYNDYGNTTVTYSSGASQNSGNAFGVGYDSGGGGWYGGKSAAGGSGYIGGVTGGSTSNGQRSGHGYARITLVTITQ